MKKDRQGFANGRAPFILAFFLLAFLISGNYCSIKRAGGDDGSEVTVSCWTASAAVKIRPDEPAGVSAEVHIKAARNEYESFQIALTDTRAVTVTGITISSLGGSAGTIENKNVMIYREAYIDIKKPSNHEGDSGWWPDALIPAQDAFFAESRSAFPAVIEANRSQAFWFDVFVPKTAAAGEYQGTITVQIAGQGTLDIPLKLTVWDFTLPSTSTLATAFGFDGWDNLLGHFGSQDEDTFDMITPLLLLYTECALMNRVTLESAIIEDWSIYPWPASAPIDWSEFDTNWSPFFDGKDLAFGLKNARLTTQRLVTAGDSDAETSPFS